MITGLTLCSGGGLAALGLQAAGVHLVGAVEYDPAIAAVYRANLGDHVLTAPVQEVDYRPWAGVDVLQVSPPCPSFSVAKSGGQETDLDTAIAAAIVRALTTIRPRYFWLENVEGYAASASYRAIRAALDNCNYWSHATVVNSADYGVPQTRRRLILRAVAGGWMQPFRPLPAPVPWVGWYAAIADLLPTLPESAFAPWQLARLPQELTQMGVLVDSKNSGQEYGKLHRLATEPAITVVTDHKQSHMPRAFLMNTSADKWGDGLRQAAEPAATIRTGQQHLPRAFLVSGTNAAVVRLAAEPAMTTTSAEGSGTVAQRAWLSQGRVVKMTKRALARFQAVPDSYDLPESNSLACKVLGNGVPVLVAEAVTASLLDSVAHERAA